MSKENKKKQGKDSKGKKPSGKIAVVVSRFNKEITSGLLDGALGALRAGGIDEKNIRVIECPGAFEIPLVAKALCRSGKYCGIVCLGAVIKGETAHFEFISSAVTSGIAKLTLDYNLPVSFGVLTCFTDEQAVKRSSKDAENKGIEAAKSTLEMIELLKSI